MGVIIGTKQKSTGTFLAVRMQELLLLLLVLLVLLSACLSPRSSVRAAAPLAAVLDPDWELVETYDHDRTSFTQGLEVYPSSLLRSAANGAAPEKSRGASGATAEHTCSSDDEPSDDEPNHEPNHGEALLVLESTGMYGDSLLRIWDLSTGEVLRETKMDDAIFGEGLTRFTTTNHRDDTARDERIAVITYREGRILVYDATTLELRRDIEEWPSPTTTTEGWGIAFDPVSEVFVVTDGSEYLHFWNTDFEEARPRVRVVIEELVSETIHGDRAVLVPPRVGGTAVAFANELEWDASTGTVLANKWLEDVVLRIDPASGRVLRVYDFRSLYPKRLREEEDRERFDDGSPGHDVFNGIAVVPGTGGKEWLLTGKYWPRVFRVRIRE
mmetsp:Transcript_31435/g.65954  ORF Transcript_31435/g.65954 Transcript_31435/m.65954 type:complete len:385 (-) Transcript_31435:1469-2623(-)